ncbi:response regulator [Shewanella donghaensis]|uniref:response regulator n=1 Tax=Shewanella donghaensis TaxID=238836 RepID=UPI0011820E73|nr:response regulator [Shewanella donghaensis]
MDKLVSVVVFYHSIEVKNLIKDIINNKYRRILYCDITTNQDEFIHFVEEKKHAYLFIYAFDAPQEAIDFNQLIMSLDKTKTIFDHKHLSLLICSREHRETAYFECIKGRFYSYETMKPIYDMNRMRLAIAHIAEILVNNIKLHQHEHDRRGLLKKLQGVSNELSHVETSIADEKSVQHVLLDDLINSIDNIYHHDTGSDEQPKSKTSKDSLSQVENFKSHNQKYFNEIGQKVRAAKPNFKKLPMVLVVDDQNVMLKIITTILKPKGFDVEVATNGAEALNKLQHCKPKLILLDIEMPVLNGIETLKAIAKLELPDSPPIIMLTSNSDKESFIECRELGAIDYIVKPTNAETLLKKVLAVI